MTIIKLPYFVPPSIHVGWGWVVGLAVFSLVLLLAIVRVGLGTWDRPYRLQNYTYL
jgi:hypothetical protein